MIQKEQSIITFLQSIKSLCPKMTQDELDFMKSGVTVSYLNTKNIYLEAGKVQTMIGFVYQGLLRAFYLDQEGNETTIRFIKENNYATNYPAFILQEPSKYCIQCLEPTVVVNLPFEHIQKCYENYSNFEKYGRLIAEEVLKSQQRRIESFQFDNAEKRYLNFIKENPDLFNRVSLSYLSSYLGIERPSLSRIRKKLASH